MIAKVSGSKEFAEKSEESTAKLSALVFPLQRLPRKKAWAVCGKLSPEACGKAFGTGLSWRRLRERLDPGKLG